MQLPGFPDIDFYLKDESIHPTGSLKHRLARSLFLYALVNGWLSPGRPVIEASSGSTAVSEAYFARLLGLPFIAVIPTSTSPEKVAAIEFHGRCHAVERACDLHDAAHQLARETGGHFMDQFTYAERATDWRANNNIAESIFKQMADEPHPIPAWIVCSPGREALLQRSAAMYATGVTSPASCALIRRFRCSSITTALPAREAIIGTTSLTRGISGGRDRPTTLRTKLHPQLYRRDD